MSDDLDKPVFNPPVGDIQTLACFRELLDWAALVIKNNLRAIHNGFPPEVKSHLFVYPSQNKETPPYSVRARRFRNQRVGLRGWTS